MFILFEVLFAALVFVGVVVPVDKLAFVALDEIYWFDKELVLSAALKADELLVCVVVKAEVSFVEFLA